jgi:hypothetical protein
MTDSVWPLSTEDHELFTEVARWASDRGMGPTQTAVALARITYAMQVAILNVGRAKYISEKHAAGEA